MIHGLNSDVRYGGGVYHVQTEDLIEGRAIESLVYHGGEVLEGIRKPYGDIAGQGNEAIRERLVAQHRVMVQAILRGRYGGSDAAPARLPEIPHLLVTDLGDPCAGEAASLLILLRSDRTFRPLPDTPLRVSFVQGSAPPETIYQGTTDAKGFHLAELQVPPTSHPEASVLIEADSPIGKARAALPVLVRGLERPIPASGERPGEKAGLVVSDLGDPRAGELASFLILFRREPSCRPIPGATLRIYFVEDAAAPRSIHEAATDPKGFHLAELQVPTANSPHPSILIEASSEIGTAEVVIPLAPASPAATPD
jgi:hypothetical protein